MTEKYLFFFSIAQRGRVSQNEPNQNGLEVEIQKLSWFLGNVQSQKKQGSNAALAQACW